MDAQSQLAAAEAELEKQRALNESLENDLLQMESHKPKAPNGDATPGDDDVLASLDLGRKSTVRPDHILCGSCDGIDTLRRRHLRGIVPFRLLHQLTLPFYLSLLARETGSDSGMRNWKRLVVPCDSNYDMDSQLAQELRKQFNIISDLRSEVCDVRHNLTHITHSILGQKSTSGQPEVV